MKPHPRAMLIPELISRLFKALKWTFKRLFVLALLASCTRQQPAESALQQQAMATAQALSGMGADAQVVAHLDTLTPAKAATMAADRYAAVVMWYMASSPGNPNADADKEAHFRRLVDSCRKVGASFTLHQPAFRLKAIVSDSPDRSRLVECLVDGSGRMIPNSQVLGPDYNEPILKTYDKPTIGQ